MNAPKPAPELQCTQWFNSAEPVTLASLRGKVVVIEAFQMLCPGCVAHGLPQVQKLRRVFPEEHVAVLGLHTVFEHHAAMTPVSLQAFLHEYKIGFPVGVDTPADDGPIPRTMAAYGMRGTPSLLLIDRAGQLRQHHFGQIEDLALGAQVALLMGEAGPEAPAASAGGQNCVVDGGCAP
ncbi:redoxin domain-containing protein [Thermomonas sp.]|uniref:redoxin domain-containing protein n=1 Tax=Thermomonas sp. TaxID=1971895 RepID=UPI001DCE611C|nr:redoxin domain-containing protein [Thermomonas sp.]MBZ0086728.1 redoxin domain-containing protein [Thermomonas sp.]HRO63105.1 redoxin domain-containing protein [Thermomonas sp.]